MSQDSQEYIRPIDKVYQMATDRDTIDWKSFLHQLIEQEGLDPWDIDIIVLTKTYLQALKDVQNVDFNISGKLLTIAVFLLKTKAEVLVDKDLRGIDEQIQEVEQHADDQELDMLESFDDSLEEFQQTKKKEYKLKVRNPLARKRKVNIFDLIKTLEKTFEQSNTRQRNYLVKNAKVSYTGPRYEKKQKDLKEIIEELYTLIKQELSNKSGHVSFFHVSKQASNKMEVLEKFIPLLHLHNHGRVEVHQEKHFGDIKIRGTQNDS